MSYNGTYQYDLFISYAHVDNTIDKGLISSGWITQFHNELALLIDRNVGKTGLIKIWWDGHLRKNDRFDPVIEDAIQKSAIFLSLTSNGYYRSDYCMKELKCFYNYAKTNEPGQFIKNQSRLFNIQQYKFDYKTWPAEFKGISSYNFFELLNDVDNFGYPLDCNSAQFKNAVKLLARDIYDLLTEMQSTKKENAVLTHSNSIFIGKVADTMYKTKIQLVRELERLNIPVIKGEVPPPYSRAEHRNCVLEKVSNSNLAVHILDDVPGSEIETNGVTYIQEQISIAKEKKVSQLIFIPKQLDLEEIDDPRHRDFLKDLQEKKLDTDKYTLIRELSVPSILNEIQLHLKPLSISRESNPDRSVFLDFHEVDTKLAIQMQAFFFKQKISTFLSMNGSSPTQTMESFESTLKEVNSVMIILGEVTKDWVRERLNKAIETILREECPVSKLGIYVAPQVSYDGLLIKQRFLQIQFLDDSRNSTFNPSTVLPFLNN